jgi:glycosyltransferase involved in cell wall biosynthesis
MNIKNNSEGIMNPKYSIIVPTYNERENIGLLIYLIDKNMVEK